MSYPKLKISAGSEFDFRQADRLRTATDLHRKVAALDMPALVDVWGMEVTIWPSDSLEEIIERVCRPLLSRLWFNPEIRKGFRGLLVFAILLYMGPDPGLPKVLEASMWPIFYIACLAQSADMAGGFFIFCGLVAGAANDLFDGLFLRMDREES